MHLRCLGIVAFIVIGLTGLMATAVSAQEASLRRVDLIPLGTALPEADVTAVRDALTAMYGVEVRVRAIAPLPKAAWYAARKRWRADKILDWLATQALDGADHLLALTAADISTTKGAVFDWGVLGLGAIDGKVGVLSRFRCGRDGVGVLQARQRLAKVAVHELGHTLGLEHCATFGCLMHDAEGKVASCDLERDLCPHCRTLLAARGLRLPVHPTPPWPMR
jgi:archaemetzincin